MEIEEKFNVKSTFFFRTQYENGDYMDYSKDIKDLVNGGWEIGLHTDPSSVEDIKKIREEKNKIEKLTNSKIFGNRVHYLSNDTQLQKKLFELNFIYDSSNRKTKDSILSEDMGYDIIDNIIEFPVTLMDAYLFTHMGISEEKIIPIIKPYKANASQKINIKTIPTNNFGCCAFALTPASPIIPIAIPAAKPDKPHAKPEDKCAYP